MPVLNINEELLREVLRVKENEAENIPIPTQNGISLTEWFKHIRQENKKIAEKLYKIK